MLITINVHTKILHSKACIIFVVVDFPLCASVLCADLAKLFCFENILKRISLPSCLVERSDCQERMETLVEQKSRKTSPSQAPLRVRNHVKRL